ncbi:DUF2226 domain-containing protein [Candidatus Micrarchaeota archaeon]|nr:DUF2226 domain-containing protein [Candidatus Micrarchaeota archaeon]
MNLPYGKAFKTNLDNASTDAFKVIEELRRKRFSGYLALAVKGQKGVEEATLLLDEGKIVGAAYEYYAYNKTFSGEKAFQRFVNATAAKHGTLEVFELTSEQVHLALAFNEDSVFVPQEQALRNVKVKEFSPFFEDEVRKDAETASPQDVSKKFKMYELTKTAPAAKLPTHEETNQ